MFISFDPAGDRIAAIDLSVPFTSPGAERGLARHARLLNTAAARRLRAAERAGSGRGEDADYWKQCAPMAVRKAAELRRAGPQRLP